MCVCIELDVLEKKASHISHIMHRKYLGVGDYLRKYVSILHPNTHTSGYIVQVGCKLTSMSVGGFVKH